MPNAVKPMAMRPHNIPIIIQYTSVIPDGGSEDGLPLLLVRTRKSVKSPVAGSLMVGDEVARDGRLAMGEEA